MSFSASSHLLTPAMAGVLEGVRRANAQPFYAMSVADARQAYVERSEVLELPRAPLRKVVDLAVPAGVGVVLRARLYDDVEPASEPAGSALVLYLHGGGFVIGGLETHDSLCRQIARLSGAKVLSLDYRLAPEHRFPTAVEDCWAVLQWLAGAGAEQLGIDPARLAVAGDSAGGTLAAVCALLARDSGLALCGQALITPGTAADARAASHQRFASGYLLEAAGIEWFFQHYIDLDQRQDWRFAPLAASELEGVAPALVLLAECDPLVDDGLAFADRLRMARVPVDLELTRGVTHDFIKMGRAIPEARTMQARLGDWLKTKLT